MPRSVPKPLTEPWAINAVGMEVVLGVWSRGEHFRDAVAQAREEWKARPKLEEPGQPVEGTGGTLRIVNGVGVLSIRGTLFRHAGLITEFSGGSSYDALWAGLETALADPNVRAILLRVNSPGGEADGTGELADYIRASRDKKPLWAYIEGLGCSAAYWLASQASRVVAYRTAMVGSIGARIGLIDTTSADEKAGVRVVDLVSSGAPGKRGTPIDDEVVARHLTRLDDLEAVFVQAVAAARDVSVEKVYKDFGQGDHMIAGKALDAGMVDELGDFNGALADLIKATEIPAATKRVASATTASSQPLARAAGVARAHVKETKMPKDALKKIRSSSQPKAEEPAPGQKAEDKEPEKTESKMVACPHCEGDGDMPDGSKCETCGGSGQVAEAEDAKADDDEHEEPDGDEEKHESRKALAALSGLRATASLAAHTAAIETKLSATAGVEKRLAALEAERAEEKQATAAARERALIERATSHGYFAGLDANAAKVKRERFLKIARNEPEAADEILANLPGARVGGRQTAQGQPLGGRHSAQPKINAFADDEVGRRVNHGDVDTIERGSPDLMTRARAYAKERSVPLEEAMVAVVRADSSLMK